MGDLASVRDDLGAIHLRSLLVNRQATPALFRSRLNDVPLELRDRWLDLVWDVEEIADDHPALPRGCVPYLPCPVATVVDAVQQARVTSTDVFVDIGSGTGRTAFLAHALTGAGCIGIEIQPALVRAATGRAAWLNLSRTRFIEGDAADWVRFMTTGTVFFLYCPFSGDRLQRFLDELEDVARARRIRVCCVDMPPLERPWLTPLPSMSVDLDVYQSLPF
ncbi:MAG TPA: methyltransferase domain-containing protein [Polyangiaceae bacterium]